MTLAPVVLGAQEHRRNEVDSGQCAIPLSLPSLGPLRTRLQESEQPHFRDALRLPAALVFATPTPTVFEIRQWTARLRSWFGLLPPLHRR